MAANGGTRQIHPFPARMAPDIALDALRRHRAGATVLDPMCGSGTVLKLGVEEGWSAIGYDLDPLAVLLSRVACTRVNASRALRAAEGLVDQVVPGKKVKIPWIDHDPKTRDFINFWFDESQENQLRQISLLLVKKRGPIADLLRVALSRTIIKKDGGASLARDTSHSRPHRVRTENDYDVLSGFLSAAHDIGKLVDRPIDGSASITLRDARRLPKSIHGKIDLIITSPPYLNAIDYMRGHKLSLVWLGYQIPQLRDIRGASIGTERGGSSNDNVSHTIVPRYRKLSPHQQSMVDRYATDILKFTDQIARVLSTSGEAVVVVGDSTINGAYVKNSIIVEKAAHLSGLTVINKRSRRIPSSSRYLPPPASGDSSLSKRMRSEVVLHMNRDN